MRKIDMFEKMYEIESDMKHYEQTYGKEHKFAKYSRFEFFGAMEIIKAAELYNDYFDFKMKKLKGV